MIRIGKYGISASDRSYEVGRIAQTKDKKTGSVVEYLTGVSYFSTLQGCLKWIRKRMHFDTVRKLDGDLQAAVEALRKSDEQFEQMIAGIEKE